MTLSIVLSEDIDRNCRPGSILSGNVQLLAAKQQPLGHVAITLLADVKSESNASAAIISPIIIPKVITSLKDNNSTKATSLSKLGRTYSPSDLSCLHTRIGTSDKVRTAGAIPSSADLPGEEQMQ